MTKEITYTVPITDQGTKSGSITGTATKFGNVAIFQIGNEKIRFVIQKNGELIGPSLVHWASGSIMVNAQAIRSMKIRHHRSGSTLRTREACRLCLEALEKKYGLARIMSTLREATVLNK